MQKMQRDKLIVILGPTASGKTALSVALAQKFDTEIVSGDSMLVYKGFDIGSAKPDEAERAGIRHHLVDILEPEASFNVTEFKARAEDAIVRINRQGKIPILVGGTGLYVKSLLESYAFNETPGDEAYRRELEDLAAARGKEHVHAMLAEVDPEAAERLHINDFRRVIRALEVARIGGETISREKSCELVYDAAVVGLTLDRARLYERINLRVDDMLAAGLVEEVRSLLARGVSSDCQAMKGIGYKEIVSYLHGDCSLEEAATLLKQSTRRFAKRQLTWYRKMPYIHWYDVEAYTKKSLMEIVYSQLAGNFSIE